MNEPTLALTQLPPAVRDRMNAALQRTGEPAEERDLSAAKTRADALAAWQAVPPRFRKADPAHPDTHPAVRAWARHYAEDPAESNSLMFHGTTGSGKTHAAYATLRAVAESGTKAYAWRALTLPNLFGALRGRSFTEAEAYLRALCRVPILLLDDLGTNKVTEWTEEVIYRVINTRYEDCLPVIFTGNHPPSALGGIVGERVASRMAEMVGQWEVALTGADRRRRPPA